MTSEYEYTELTDREHILETPDMYLGSLKPVKELMWIIDPKNSNKFGEYEMKYSPALLKIFDEPLVNSRDQYIRTGLVKNIKVEIDQENNTISIYNDGPGFSVYHNTERNVWSVEQVLTRTKTSSNFNKADKTTGGRYGYGAKLTVIFSKVFKVETVDAERGLKYTQTYRDNLSIIDEPKITKFGGKPYTRLTFQPSLEKFGMNKLGKAICSLIAKRTYDIAAYTPPNVHVYLNNTLTPVRTIKDYVSMYLDDGEPIVYEKFNDRWEVCVANLPQNKDEFMQVSSVNGINTYMGGTHVDYIVSQLCRKIKRRLVESRGGEKYKDLSSSMIRSTMFVCVVSVINDPKFTSQTKEKLNTPPKLFGSSCVVSDEYIDKIQRNLNIFNRIKGLLTAKESTALEKNSGSIKNRVNVPKLHDAKLAGTAKRAECTIILTEGDSAKAFALSGISQLDGDYFGVFPLRGKLKNPRGSKTDKIVDNTEILNLVKILGLVFGKKYKSTSELRYGHVLILTDADLDGSHIKGLLINFIHNYWPELTRLDEFIESLTTPILKATHRRTKRVHEFFSQSLYDKWKSSVNLSEYNIKYYKGLGTSTATEAREYFGRYDELLKKIKNVGKQDDDAVLLAFDKTKADDRKKWLCEYDPHYIMDNSMRDMSVSDFVHRELKHFSVYDNVRSIPSLVDGLKPSQRKVLYGCFKRNLTNEIKVNQLANYVSEHTHYLHGEESLNGTIVGMAQDYVGANNIELLSPNGQFGTIVQGGEDAASPRYIFTQLAPLTRTIFDKRDDNIVEYLKYEGDDIEPEWYIPIIPLVLINGAHGIGTGYSTHIPNYNPLDIIDNIEKIMNGGRLRELTPYYRNFAGSIIKIAPNRYISKGHYTIIKPGVIKIDLLPIGVWSEKYKEKLEKMESEKKIQKIESLLTDVRAQFTVYISLQQFNELKNEKSDENGIDAFEREFKLISPLYTTNIHLFNDKHVITRYTNVNKIISEFYDIRIKKYNERKSYFLLNYERDLNKLKAKMKFIKLIITDQLIIKRRSKIEICNDLEKFGVPKLDGGYGYLLSLPLYSLTKDDIDDLKSKYITVKSQLDELKTKSAEDLWRDDLAEFKVKYAKFLADDKKLFDEKMKLINPSDNKRKVKK